MKQIFRSFIVLLTLLAALPALAAESHKSPGGIPFFLTRITDAKQVVFRVYWPHDWPYEAGHNPLAPAIGAQLMIQGGAGGKMPLTLLQKFNELNTSGQIIATRYGIIGALALGKDNIPAAANLVADVLGAPTLDGKWLKRIKSNTRRTQAEANKKISAQAWTAVRYAELGNSPLQGFYSGDDLGNFDRLTQKDVQDWHRQTFQRAGMVVSVAGPITAKEAGIAIDLMAAKLPEGKKPKTRKVKTRKHTKRIWLHLPKAKKALIGYSGPIPPNSQGHEVEDLIAIYLLAGNTKTGLMHSLRSEMRATYGVSAALTTYDRQNKFISFGLETKPKDVAKVDQAVRAHYRKFRGGELDLPYLKAIRNDLANGIDAGLKKPANAAFIALENHLDGFGVQRVNRLVKEIRAITPDALKRHLKRDFPKEADLTLVVASPKLPESDGFCVIRKPAEAAGC